MPYTADLIGMLPVIQRQEFVFVRGVNRSITGIVTVADVVEVYGQMASPFFMIGRIDQSLRRIIEATFPIKTITPPCDPDGLRDLHSYDQLTMGDYQRILENLDCWADLGWPLHRKTFCARLEKIGKVRNNIMHFNNLTTTLFRVMSFRCCRTSSTYSRIMVISNKTLILGRIRNTSKYTEPCTSSPIEQRQLFGMNGRRLGVPTERRETLTARDHSALGRCRGARTYRLCSWRVS